MAVRHPKPLPPRPHRKRVARKAVNTVSTAAAIVVIGEAVVPAAVIAVISAALVTNSVVPATASLARPIRQAATHATTTAAKMERSEERRGGEECV